MFTGARQVLFLIWDVEFRVKGFNDKPEPVPDTKKRSFVRGAFLETAPAGFERKTSQKPDIPIIPLDS